MPRCQQQGGARAARGVRAGLCRYWACTAEHSPASVSAIDTYFEKAAWLGTILAGRIVTSTIVHSVTYDTI